VTKAGRLAQGQGEQRNQRLPREGPRPAHATRGQDCRQLVSRSSTAGELRPQRVDAFPFLSSGEPPQKNPLSFFGKKERWGNPTAGKIGASPPLQPFKPKGGSAVRVEAALGVGLRRVAARLGATGLRRPCLGEARQIEVGSFTAIDRQQPAT